jgi:prevent-host-death family protein
MFRDGDRNMTHKTAAEVGAKLSENLKSVETTGEPVAIENEGRTVAVLVSAEDFALFQRLRQEEEDRIDNAAADAALAEGGESIPWERVKADLGL